MLHIYFTQCLFLCNFWRLKIFVLWQKIVQNLVKFVYLFRPKNCKIYFTKAFITQEWLVTESCPTPSWITFLMFYRLACSYTLLFQWTNFGLKCLLMWYFKSATMNLLTWNVSSKTKKRQIWDQKYVIQVILSCSLIKAIVKYLISILSNLRNYKVSSKIKEK